MPAANQMAYFGPVFNSLYAYDGRKLASDYELLREYATNDIVYACVNYNANAVAQVPYRLYTTSGKGQKAIRSHASTRSSRLTKARLRANPNLVKMIGPGDDVVEITEHPILDLLHGDNDGLNGFDTAFLTQIYKEIMGRAYWQLDMAGLMGVPTSFYILKPQRTMPVRDGATGAVIGYKYQPDLRGTWEDLETADVVDYRFPHPEDPYGWGMSPLKSCFAQAELTAKFTKYGNDLMDNRARIDGMFIPSDDMGPDMARKAEDQFAQRFSNGRAGGVWFSPTKGTFVPTRYAPTDLGPMEIDKNTVSRVCRAFSIPEPLMSANEATFSNMDKALQFHAKFATTPRILQNEQRMNTGICPLFDDRLFLAADNPVPEDNEFELKKVQVAMGGKVLTPNEIREALDYEALPDEGMDELPATDEELAQQQRDADAAAMAAQGKAKAESAKEKPVAKAFDAGKLIEINKAVVNGDMPRTAAITAIVKAFDVTAEDARDLVGFAKGATNAEGEKTRVEAAGGDDAHGKQGEAEADALALSKAEGGKASGGGHWITIGGGGEEGEGGGTHVFIQDGRIAKGPAGLQGKKLGELGKEHRDSMHDARRTREPTHTDADKKVHRKYSESPVHRELMDWHKEAGGVDDYLGESAHTGTGISRESVSEHVRGGGSINAHKKASGHGEDFRSNLIQEHGTKRGEQLYQDYVSNRLSGEGGRIDAAIEAALSAPHENPRQAFLAHHVQHLESSLVKVDGKRRRQAVIENAPQEELDTAKLMPGDKFHAHGDEFAAHNVSGTIVLRGAGMELPYADTMGHIPIDKGSHKVGDPFDMPPEETEKPKKTSGQQKGLLGEAFDGPTVGSKSGNMFGDVSAGPANALEAKGNNVGQAEKDHETAEMFDGKPVNSKHQFSVKRLVGDEMKDITFERGEHVRISFGSADHGFEGPIEAISPSREMARVGQSWHKYGTVYKTEQPPAPSQAGRIKTSEAIELINNKFGDGLTEADRVPIEFQSPNRKKKSDPEADITKASTADGLLDTLVDSHDRLTPEQKKRRKQFLLLLMAYFGWHAEALAEGRTVDANARLAKVLRNGMAAKLTEATADIPILTRGHALAAEQADTLAALINGTTEKSVAAAVSGGQAIADAVDAIYRRSIETRAAAIEDDAEHLGGQIAVRAEADVTQRELVWRTKDEGACVMCLPLNGLVAKVGEPFAPGIYLPVVNTHTHCRCETELVPLPEAEGA